MRRVLLVAGTVLCAVLAYQSVTYVLYGKASMLLTLADQLPSSDLCSAVCIDRDLQRSLSDDQQKSLGSLLMKRFRSVYHGEDAIPDAYKRHVTQDPESGGYRDLCIVGWVVKQSGLFWFRAAYSESEGPLSVRGQEATYAWMLIGWRKVGTTTVWDS